MIAAHQDEERLMKQFIEAMYTGTIVRRGALYVYDHGPDEDPWEPFANVMKAGRFLDFEIYAKLRGLQPKQMAQLQRKSSERSRQMTASEDISDLLGKLQEMAGVYQDAKAALDYDRGDYVNGEELYRFYKEMAGKVNEMVRSLK